MDKNKLYALAKEVTPPFIFASVKKSPLYPKAKRIIGNLLPKTYAPEWKRISRGKLEGREIFVSAGSIVDEMFEGAHDNFMLEYVKPGQTVLDIGAHVGSNAMLFALAVGNEGKVHSFEPNPFNISYFKRNLERNDDLKDRIEIHDIALSDGKGSAEFMFTDNVEGGASSGSFLEQADTIWPKEDYEQKAGFRKMSVRTDTLDGFLENTDIRPDVVKIDVEGAEHAVLDGAARAIAEHKPLFLIEIHSIFNMYEVLETLTAAGYLSEIVKKEPDGRCFLVAKPAEKVER